MTTCVSRLRALLSVTRNWMPVLASLMICASVHADSRTRRYDFEEGTANATASTVDDKISTHLTPAFGDYFSFDYLVPGTNFAVPQGEPVKTFIDAIDSTPALTTAPGATNGGTFVASNSPAPG